MNSTLITAGNPEAVTSKRSTSVETVSAVRELSSAVAAIVTETRSDAETAPRAPAPATTSDTASAAAGTTADTRRVNIVQDGS
jgi:hypothetical protein